MPRIEPLCVTGGRVTRSVPAVAATVGILHGRVKRDYSDFTSGQPAALCTQCGWMVV